MKSVSNRIGKRQGRENGQCDLVRVDHLQITGLMIAMLMSYLRVVSVILFFWGDGSILGNGYGI